MQKLDSLKYPTKTLCAHCGDVAVRQEESGFYSYSYKCGCGRFGSTGVVYGVGDYEWWVVSQKEEGAWNIPEGCGLHKKCGVKNGDYLQIQKVDDEYFVKIIKRNDF